MAPARAWTAVALPIALAMAGCGGSAAPRNAPAAPGAPVAASSGSPETPAGFEQATLEFAKCMRANGVPDFPNPSGGGFRLPPGVTPGSPALVAAHAKCQNLLPGGGPPGPGSTSTASPQVFAHYLGIARCMRRHGISDFPDPRTSVPPNPFGSGGSGVISNIEGVIFVFGQSIDQQSPGFVAAAGACRFPLHNH